VRRSVALLLLAGTSVQFGAAFAVHLFDRLGPGGTVLLRLALAAAVLLAIWRPRVRGRSWPELRVAIALGVVLGLMNWCFYEALGRIPLGPTVTIEFIGPLSVGLWGSRRPLDLLWVALAAAGVLALADPFGAGGLDPAGVGLALGAAACWAVYIPLSARTGRVWPGASGLAFGMGFGALVALPAGVAQGGSELLAPGLLAAGLLVALASSVIPYSLEMEALRTLPEHVFGVLMSLEPAIAALAGLVVLGQGLTAGDVVAIALVVVASIGVTTAATRRPVRLASEPCEPSPSATAG
jgi:inner membrane transporter RhtA